MRSFPVSGNKIWNFSVLSRWYRLAVPSLACSYLYSTCSLLFQCTNMCHKNKIVRVQEDIEINLLFEPFFYFFMNCQQSLSSKQVLYCYKPTIFLVVGEIFHPYKTSFTSRFVIYGNTTWYQPLLCQTETNQNCILEICTSMYIF